MLQQLVRWCGSWDSTATFSGSSLVSVRRRAVCDAAVLWFGLVVFLNQFTRVEIYYDIDRGFLISTSSLLLVFGEYNRTEDIENIPISC